MEAEEEMRLRKRASTLIQLALCVLNATHLSVPSTVWYIRTLDAAQKKATQFKVSVNFFILSFDKVLVLANTKQMKIIK